MPKPKSDLEHLQDERAKNALIAFLGDVALQQREMQAAYLGSPQGVASHIQRPQVFFSYAWGELSDPRFIALQTFLKHLKKDFEQAGIAVWLDLSRLVGHIESQMREGIDNSHIILLMGTELYAKKTRNGSFANVKKELDFGVQRALEPSCDLIPLALEGGHGAIFPSLDSRYLSLDAGAWLDLGNPYPISEMRGYIKALTAILDPVGLLPAALGLHRDDYPEYRRAFNRSYTRSQALLVKELEAIYAPVRTSSSGNSPQKPVIFPMRRIPFSDLQFGVRLGAGSYGTVHQGLWKQMPVAIKEIRGTLNAETQRDFNTEAEVMVRANSTRVVRLWGVAEEPQRIALVMELMPYGSLNQLLHNGQTLDWKIRYQISEDIAHGLLLLHGDGILHRDLKSDNVLLDDRLRAKLSDFGLAKIKSTARSSSNRGGLSLGTESWMAPELFLDFTTIPKDPVTKKRIVPKIVYTEQTDIYSYGIVLWEIASRQSPYAEMGLQGSNLQSFVRAGEREEIPDGCPDGFKALIEGAWEQEPQERLSLELMLERLRVLNAAEAASAVVETAPPAAMPVVFSKPAALTPLKVAAAPVPTPSAVSAVAQAITPASPLSVVSLRGSLPSVVQSSSPAILVPPTSSLVLPNNVVPFTPARSSRLAPINPQALSQFLRLIAEGEQDQVEDLLKNNPDLGLYPGKVTDLSKRTFEGITGFQLAVWGLDWHMWTMLMKYLPLDAAVLQAQDFETGPWVRTQGIHAGPHLQRLINALKTYIDMPWDAAKCCAQWQGQVGGAQLLLPISAINEYCRPDRSFDPCPKFLEPTLPRSRKTDEGEWFTASYNGGKLGEKFACVRAGGPLAYCGVWRRGGGGSAFGVWPTSTDEAWSAAMHDHDAVVSLTKIRTQQRDALISELRAVAESTPQSQRLRRK